MSLALTTSSSKSSLGLAWARSGSYGVVVALFFLALTAGSALVTYQLYVNYFPDSRGYIGDVAGDPSRPELLFLKSEDSISKMKTFGLSEKGYLERLDSVRARYTAAGYPVRYVSEAELAELPPRSVLFAIDTIALSDAALGQVQSFVRNGGSLVFNYHFAYHGDDGYRDSRAVTDITGLKYSAATTHVKPELSYIYVTPAILSPLVDKIYPKGSRIGTELYDPLPVFVSDRLAPDAVLTNRSVTSPMTITSDNGAQYNLGPQDAGVMWHGRYGNGNWVYTTLPSYSWFAKGSDTPLQLDALITGIADFLSRETATLVSYPYLDADRVVFVSEDTEYKFEFFDGFIRAAEQYRIPVTAFLVAELAEKNPALVGEAERSRYVELGSHSYSHKKIVDTGLENIQRETGGSKALIESLAPSHPVRGFRPPREELDAVMVQQLVDAGYTYVLGASKTFQYPTVEPESAPLYSIPRTATDDYQYLVNLDWDADTILRRMIAETELITSVQGVYTLSIHTHLMAYKNNIRIIERYFDYVNKQRALTPMNGDQIIQRVRLLEKVRYDVVGTQKNLLLKVHNGNATDISTLRFRLYWPAGMVLGDVRPELIGARVSSEANEQGGYTDVRIDGLKPNASLGLIVERRAL